MAALWMGMVALALAAPTTTQTVDLTWVPPPTAGLRVPAMAAKATDRALVRKPWCDFGHHAQRYAINGQGPDPVFRRPSAQGRNAFDVIRDGILDPNDYRSPAASEASMAKLVLTADGPPLVRIGILDKDPRIQLLALNAGRAIVALQPRLAAFATGLLGSPDPKLAIAALELHFASACDTAVMYGMDGMRHPDEGVQLTTLKLVFGASQTHDNLRLAERVASAVRSGLGTARTRVVALRMLGRLGTQAATNDVEAMLNDKQDVVAGEALATLAILQPGIVEKRVQKWLKDKSPYKRAGALRAFAQLYAERRDMAEKVLRPLLADTTPVPDRLGVGAAPGPTLGAVARAALDYIELP